MNIAKRTVEVPRSDRPTDRNRQPTPVERLARTLTAALDAAESEPICVADPADEEGPK
jgi:hypothetical protein